MSEEKKRGTIFFINCKDEGMIYNLMSERNLSQGFLSTIKESLDRTRHGESVVFLNLDKNSELNIGSHLQSPLNKVVLIDVVEDEYIHSYRCFTTNFSLYTLKYNNENTEKTYLKLKSYVDKMIDYTDVDAKLEEYSEAFDFYMECGEMPPTMPPDDCLAGYMQEVIDNYCCPIKLFRARQNKD